MGLGAVLWALQWFDRRVTRALGSNTGSGLWHYNAMSKCSIQTQETLPSELFRLVWDLIVDVLKIAPSSGTDRGASWTASSSHSARANMRQGYGALPLAVAALSLTIITAPTPAVHAHRSRSPHFLYTK
jgi:hypothetical protein